jgi:hypothetical protein
VSSGATCRAKIKRVASRRYRDYLHCNEPDLILILNDRTAARRTRKEKWVKVIDVALYVFA